MPDSRVVIDERRYQQFRKGLASGLFHALSYIDGEAKAITPVHGDPGQGGDFSTFVPGEKPIGGTLRRSIHTVIYIDGRRVFGDSADENGKGVPSDYPVGRGIEGFVGTNIEYAIFVHDGTVKMQPPRPFLGWAWVENEGRMPGLIAQGYAKVMGTSGR